MKHVIVLSAALLLAGGCNHEDTVARGVWRRSVEPRLSTTREWQACVSRSVAGHVVVGARCADATVLSGGCDDPIGTREDADAMLLTKPRCSDVAIARLEAFSHADAVAMSDLAGAYYVRAQRNDDPADLLHAFDAARAAVAVKPVPAGAQFNYALILEALSLDDAAIDAWQLAAASDDAAWAAEARQRGTELRRKRALDGRQRWPGVRQEIDRAAAAGDIARTRRLIAKFPASAEQHFENDILPQWLDSPASVRTFAAALTQFFNDPFFEEVVAPLRDRAHAERVRSGLRALTEAAAKAATQDYPAAAAQYARAAAVFREANNPLMLLARIGHAGQAATDTGNYGPAAAELDEVGADARRYPSVVARVDSSRIYPYNYLGRYADVFAAHDAAVAFYERIGDWEDRDAVDVRAIATMNVVGLTKTGWRAAFVAVRDATRLPDVKVRFLLLGTTATAALDHDAPEAAFAYQSLAADVARDGTPAVVVSALSHLAEIEIRLRRFDDARRHLAAAAQLLKDDKERQRVFGTRLAAVEGEAAMQLQPQFALEPLTRAIDLATNTEYPTFTAVLHARRAEAYRLLGRSEEEEADRREALRLLHQEEDRLLEQRKRGTGIPDDFWVSYFSRFDDTYDLLIRQLLARGAVGEAFRYSDRVRAYEPLDLARRSSNAPPEFRELARDPHHLDVGKLQAIIPAGTFLIEYRVFDDATYAWILSGDRLGGLWVPARRNEVKRWTDALRNAAADKNTGAFENGLFAPYDRLLKGPLDVIHGMPGGRTAKIVIIPDRELRAMPFAALRNPDTKHYLIQDHTSSISGSALLYAFSLLRDRRLPPDVPSALLIGDPAFDRSPLSAGFERLPYARAEVTEIGGLYARHETLLDAAATPQQFLRLADSASVIHVAAHAVVNGEAPSQSYLLFHGVLTAETLTKDFHAKNARLMILGACSSAGGLPVGAEGIAPLVRPIIGAGVPGVIGALWNIDDATAWQILVSFHRHYRRGDDAAEALRQAQLELLRSKNPGLVPARVWAPYEAIGVASSPFRSIADLTKEKPP